MNEFEKKIRNKLLMRGFPNEKLLNNRGLIGATIDEVILEVVKNIGVTRCCETFNDKETPTFEEWLKKQYIEIKKDKTILNAYELSDCETIFKIYLKKVHNI